MDPRFREHLDRFIMTTLAPANLVPKTIAGKVVKSKEMVDYFSKYLEIFYGDEIPEPKSIFESTAEVNTGCLETVPLLGTQKVRHFVFRYYTSVRPQTLATRITHEGSLLLKFQVWQRFSLIIIQSA